jgi:uncharacterized protein (DUF433 family)
MAVNFGDLKILKLNVLICLFSEIKIYFWQNIGLELFFVNLYCKKMKMIDYKNTIVLDPEKRSGKPCIRGMRITVYDILSYLAAGMTFDEIIEDFPELTANDILACLSFAANRERLITITAA